MITTSNLPNFLPLNPLAPNSEYIDRTAILAAHTSVRSRWKRLIDILGAVIGLGITALVAMPVALALALDNPGPIFYSQTRCGLNGHPFQIWKFRSMVVGAEHLKHLVNNEASGHIFKNQNDPRITRVGRFLRRTSLDELPSFGTCWSGKWV